MAFRTLTPTYTTSPQIDVADIPQIRDAGYRTVICNRPDAENPPELSAARMRAAVEAAGMVFVDNPIIGGALNEANVRAQRAAIDAAEGPVFAYCASGNRSSIVWALATAAERPTGDTVAAAARWGYNLEPYRAQIAALGGG
jgi:uncharacterized protein (TIGR01244 family)